MANVGTITFIQLINQIKKEARISGSDDLDQFIKDTINEQLLEFCLNNRYFENLVLNTPITTLLATGLYTLPDDFQHIRLVRYWPAAVSQPWTLHQRTEWIETPPGNLPRWFDLITSRQLSIFPYTSVPAGDTLYLDYYKFPTTLSADGDTFPLPKIIASLKQKVIYRTHIYNNEIQVASALKSDSMAGEIRAKPTK